LYEILICDVFLLSLFDTTYWLFTRSAAGFFATIADASPAYTFFLSSATHVEHTSRIFLAPALRIASFSGILAFVSSSTVTVISRSSYVSSLRSGIVILPLASVCTLPCAQDGERACA